MWIKLICSYWEQTCRLLVGLSVGMVLCIFPGCKRTIPITPFPRRVNLFNLPKVPLILVGQALEKCHPAAPLEYSGLDGRPYQLWKVRVRVEQVIQGEIPSKEVDIFYFVDWGPGSSAWSRLVDIYGGHSELFFLQKDGSRWRTVDDGWRNCVLWVRTGTHYRYKIDTKLPIQDIFTNLILNRGEHTSDAQMIDAIYHIDMRWGTAPAINRLGQLMKEDPSSKVRAVAFEVRQKLQRFYGKGDRVTSQDIP